MKYVPEIAPYIRYTNAMRLNFVNYLFIEAKIMNKKILDLMFGWHFVNEKTDLKMDNDSHQLIIVFA